MLPKRLLEFIVFIKPDFSTQVKETYFSGELRRQILNGPENKVGRKKNLKQRWYFRIANIFVEGSERRSGKQSIKAFSNQFKRRSSIFQHQDLIFLCIWQRKSNQAFLQFYCLGLLQFFERLIKLYVNYWALVRRKGTAYPRRCLMPHIYLCR